MAVVLFVGNLSHAIAAADLVALFAQAGTVERARIPRHRDTHRPRRFGFVEMASRVEARQAIQRFDGYHLRGRPLRVTMAADQRGAGADARGCDAHGRRGGSGSG